MDDLASRLGLVTRVAETIDVGGRPSRRIVLERTYGTDAPDLWDAVTNPGRIPRWFLPVSGDLVPGGTFQLEGHAGGTIESCEPPHRLHLTWGSGGAEPVDVVVTLVEVEGGTRLRLEQLGQVPEELWERFGPSATGLGWDFMLVGLGVHVDTRAAVDPQEAMAWMGSPDGVAFTEGAAAAWRDADVVGGTGVADAARRIAHTLAVYRGEEEPPQW
ncbi:MAG: SRPBCC domain-containing protein [Kineosporiaceae bacterium]